MKRRNSTYHMSILSILIAIIILQDFIPMLGNIPIGPLSLTTLHVTVIITAIVLGPVDGAIVGGVWGVITWIRAFTMPSSAIAPLVFVNPVVSVVPRIMIGLIAGWVFIGLTKVMKKPLVPMILSSVAGALTNTILVLGLIYLFYDTPAVAHSYGVNVHNLFKAFVAIFATNGIAEMVLAAVIAPAVATPLRRLHRPK
ncbi:ECF transporter S component [Paucilactobacillus suebicus]|nr:ECF transporter S component [Paucilactobacillus suebicus]